MTIEAKLDETNNLLRKFLAAYQSGQQVAGETAATGTRKRRTKAEIEADEAAAAAAAAAASSGAQTAPVVDGDPAGTVYWASDAHKLVFAQKPGETAPQGNEFSQVSSTDYLAKKEAFAAAEKAAATQQTSANTAPSATAQQATASGATSGAAEPTWDEVVAGLKSLAQNPAHGATAVMATVQKFKPGAANVPALKDLGQNAAILAHVNSLLNPSASAGAEVDPLFG